MTACADISLSVSQAIHFREICGSQFTVRKNFETNKKLMESKLEWKQARHKLKRVQQFGHHQLLKSCHAAASFTKNLRTAGNLIYHMLSTVQQMDHGILVFSVLSLHLSIQALGKRLVSRLITHGCSLRAWLFHQCIIAERTENPFSRNINEVKDSWWLWRWFIMSVSKLSEGKSVFKEQISQSWSAGRRVLWSITCKVSPQRN